MNINRINKLIGRKSKMNKVNEDSIFKANLTKIRENQKEDLKTIYDQPNEEQKFRSIFDDLNVIIDFIPLEIQDDYIFWGGTVDNMIQFTYKITPNETTSGISFNYTDDFSADDPDNQEIVKRIENYYDSFFDYWRDNIFN